LREAEAFAGGADVGGRGHVRMRQNRLCCVGRAIGRSGSGIGSRAFWRPSRAGKGHRHAIRWASANSRSRRAARRKCSAESGRERWGVNCGMAGYSEKFSSHATYARR
jgi:hypothetical protein